jgi:phosphinothricin acetyltransferase
MRRRMDDVFAASLPWLVAESDGHIRGYAYATKWKARSAYRFSVETTVYLADGLGRQGLGSRLYEELFRLLKKQGIHAAIGGIALPNDASVALHEKLGMRKVAHFEQVGFKFGKWVDVAYWERFL